MTLPTSPGPILLLAYERSGTNLLRRFMRRHPSIDGPSPIHLLNWLGPPTRGLEDRLEEADFRRLAADAVTIASLPFEPWTIPLSVSEIVDAIAPEQRTLLTLFGWLHDRHAEAAGKITWFCKDKDLVHHAPQLAARWPTARFIYLHRDPRDVFASYVRAPGGFKHPLPFIAEWAERQHRTLELLRHPEIGPRIHHTSYEAIVKDERTEVRSLCEFLGLAFTEDLLQTGGAKQISGDNSYWKNVEKPVMRSNTGGFRTTLRRGQVRLIEEGAWDEMVALGYRPEVATGARKPGRPRRWFGKVYNGLVRRWIKQFRAQTAVEREVVQRRTAFRRHLASRKRDA